jgi:hypothetical protein
MMKNVVVIGSRKAGTHVTTRLLFLQSIYISSSSPVDDVDKPGSRNGIKRLVQGLVVTSPWEGCRKNGMP